MLSPPQSLSAALKTVPAAAVALLLWGTQAPQALAAPGWLAPTDLSAVGQDAEEPQVAVDSAGDAFAVWSRSNGFHTIIQAAIRPAGGSWGSIVDLSAAGRNATEPQLAVDPAGDAVAVWSRSNGSHTIIQAASRPAGGGWSGPMDLSAAGRNAAEPQVAIDSSGDAVAAWQRFDGIVQIVQSRSRAASGAWGATDELSEPGQDAEAPQVAVDPAGNAVAVWSRRDGSNLIVQAASKPAGGAWLGAIDLSEEGENAEAPQVAVDPTGGAVVVWSREEGADKIVQSSAKPAGGAWLAPDDLSAAGLDAEAAQVAVDPAGNAVAVWISSPGPPTVIVQGAVRPAGGAWLGPDDLSAGGLSSAEAPQVAVDPAGNAAAVWARSAGSPTVVEASTKPAGGGWLPPVPLSELGNSAVEAQISLDPAGDGVAVWSRQNGVNAIVQGAGFDRAGPQLRSLSIPEAGTARQPVAFSVSPFDTWAGFGATSWQFGDGGASADTVVEHTYGHPGVYRVTVESVDTFGNASEASGEVTVYSIARAARFARVRRGRALLRLFCPSPAGCRGVIRLIASATIERNGRRFGRRMQIGRRAFHVPRKGVETVPVRLTRKGRGLVGQAGKKGLRTQLTGPGVKHRLLILLPPRKATQKRRKSAGRR
jgi:hypothetical protein